MSNPIILAKNLIKIPSYVDVSSNETSCSEFLEKYITNTFPTLSIERQYISTQSKRYNLLISGGTMAELLIVGHIDTVQPTTEWVTNPLIPTIKNDKLYGLGSSDMKSSLAACLSALKAVKNTIDLSKISFLLYVDEEYDFKGMRKFISSGCQSNPKVIFNLDGDLELSTGCRGLIELELRIKGKSSHSSNPSEGINVIRCMGKVIDDLEKILYKKNNTFLGPTTLNLAYLKGGTLSERKGKKYWQKEGNIIPDVAELILEIRPSVKNVTAKSIIQDLEKLSQKYRLSIDNVKIRHDIKPWFPKLINKDMEILKSIYSSANQQFKIANMKFSGYVDTQMLAEKVTCPIFVIGTGGENAHGANENVKIQSIRKAQRIYEQIFLTYCKV